MGGRLYVDGAVSGVCLEGTLGGNGSGCLDAMGVGAGRPPFLPGRRNPNVFLPVVAGVRGSMV